MKYKNTKYRVWNGIEWIGVVSIGHSPPKTDFDNWEDLIFCESTGLTDNYGKDIYEGHIIKTGETFCNNGDPFDLENATYEVIWNKKKLMWWCKLLNKGANRHLDLITAITFGKGEVTIIGHSLELKNKL